MGENTLILGLAAGFHAGDVRPFLASLTRTGYQGRCVLFTSPTTRETDCMAELDAIITSFSRPPSLEHVPYNAWRYFLYHDYLRECAQVFDRILLTDVRDVIFQRHPFSFAWPDIPALFLEDAGMRAGDCPHMQRWILGHLGLEVLQPLSGERIICSGTTIAGHDAMLHYLELMTSRLLPYAPGKGMAGYDQGLHNHLARSGALGEVQYFDNGGPVLTLGYKPEPPELDAKGQILNDNGEPAHIVHQYDRHPELFAAVRREYACPPHSPSEK